MEDEVTLMVEEIKTRQHVLFSRLNGLTDEDGHTVWECVPAVRL